MKAELLPIKAELLPKFSTVGKVGENHLLMPLGMTAL
jgi:hypothetical protein